MKRILVTGSSGFIGFHLSKALLRQGCKVTGLDNMNPYYDVRLKESRLSLLKQHEGFSFIKGDLEDRKLIEGTIQNGNFCAVVHLAAQAGVRYSLECPEAYISSNLVGFFHIIEACKAANVPHLLFASSSSIYGANTKLPFSVEDKTDSPVSLYAATKKSNELTAHAYSHMFGLPCTGLRFFTVYGPYGRPDMALFKFTKAMLAGEPIDVYNNGDMQRDFTYVDDVVAGILALMEKSKAICGKGTPYEVYNIGNHSPVQLMDFVCAIEKAADKQAKINYKPMQPGDVKSTFADVDALIRDTGFAPNTPIEDGVRAFVEWYREYYGGSRLDME